MSQAPIQFDTLPDDFYTTAAIRYLPLATIALEDPPIGHVRLVEPVKSARGLESERDLQEQLRERRLQLEHLLANANPRVLDQRALEFAFLTCKLIWQRFRRIDFVVPHSGDNSWLRRLLDHGIVANAQTLYEQHGDVLLAVGTNDLELLAPSGTRRSTVDSTVVSLNPVIEALAMRGLWITTDDQIDVLAHRLIELFMSDYRNSAKSNEPNGGVDGTSE